MNHQYNNSKLAAAINGLTSSHTTNHHHIQQQQQQQQQTTDAIIVQSNSSVVSDEFLLQLQEQFGGENKQIYILNNHNQVQGSNSSNQNHQSNNDQNNSVQYLIVDKDVDINVILQDPNIFNQTNLNQNGTSQPVQNQIQQHQQQQQQNPYTGNSNNLINTNESVQIGHLQQMPLVHQQNHYVQPNVNSKPYLAKQQLINQNISTNRYSNSINHVQKNISTTSNTISSLSQNNNLVNNQVNAIEESIQRVQVPPPKRKQFEFKLENKKNSYQDVFLRFLAGEKQPTLEIIADPASKKPKDNLYYSNGASSNGFSGNSTRHQSQTNQSQAKTTISSTVSSATASPSNSMQSNGTSQASTSIVVNGFQSNNQAANLNGNTVNTTGTIDKENYYNSSRRENLLPLNNYEYRNSYKDHYDNQGVRVNPAVLKNLSYTSSAATASKSTNNNSSNSNGNNTSNNNFGMTEVNGSNRPVTPLNRTISQTGEKMSSPNINNNLPILAENVDANFSKQKPTNATKTDQLNNHMYGYTNNQTTNDKLENAPVIVDGIQDVVSNVSSNNGSSNASNSQNSLTEPNNTTNHLNDGKILEQQKSAKSQQQQQHQNETRQESTSANVNVNNQHQLDVIDEEITFASGEFLIHKSTFSGDFDNYDIWSVLDDGYLQKYEPVLLASGERCHQSADVLAQYTPDKSEFLLVKVDEKGKTEQNNIVVGVLNEYEPKNRKIFTQSQQIIGQIVNSTNSIDDTSPKTTTDTSTTAERKLIYKQGIHTSPSANNNSNVVVVTYDDLKSTLDVFLQVLLSQHLNGEFLLRIKELQDEYFKPSIEFIDTILNEKYSLIINNFNHFMNLKKSEITNNNLQSAYSLDILFKYLFETKPKLISQEAVLHMPTKCQAVNTLYDITTDSSLIASYLVKFSGPSYNSDTLISITDYANNPFINEQYEKEGLNKEFLVCGKSLQFAQLCHSVKHLKMNFYEICQQKIEQVKLQMDESSDATAASEILNYCLADTQWLLEMFEKFKQLLFDVDSLLSDDQQSMEHTNGSPNIEIDDPTAQTAAMSSMNMQNGINNHQSNLTEEATLCRGEPQSLEQINVNSHLSDQQHSQHSFQDPEGLNGIQTTANDRTAPVETNKLINVQMSQIIDDVEEINQMETS